MSVNISDNLINLISNKYLIDKEVISIKFKQELSTRKIYKFSNLIYLKFILILLKELILLLSKIIKNFISKKSTLIDSSFLLGFPDESIFIKDDKYHFQKFWLKGPLKNFCQNTRIFIFTKNYVKSNEGNFQYLKCHIDYLIQTLEKKEKINLAIKSIKDLIVLLTFSLKEKSALLISKDICYLSLFRKISKNQKKINFFFNANSYSHNIICFSESDNFKTYFCYYSMNNLPVTYSTNSKINLSDYNYLYKYLYINFHLVWNNYHKATLKKNGLQYGKFLNTGPYLYYLNNDIVSKKKNRIIVFDVEPHKNINPKNSYYNNEYCIGFLKDIINSFKEFKHIEIILKHKIRSKATIKKFDNKYSNFLIENDKYFKIADREENLFSLINSSVLCINFPYTSTATIAKSLGVESIYFDTTNTLDTQEYGIKIIKGGKELNKFVNSFFKNI